MKTIIAQFANIAIAAAVLLSLGCAAEKQSFSAYYPEDSTPKYSQTNLKSLALDSRATITAENESGSNAARSNWYDSRNDFSLETYAGRRSTIVDYSYTRTYDRQYNTSNRVHNNYSQHTWQYRTVGTSQ